MAGIFDRNADTAPFAPKSVPGGVDSNDMSSRDWAYLVTLSPLTGSNLPEAQAHVRLVTTLKLSKSGSVMHLKFVYSLTSCCERVASADTITISTD